MLSGQVATRKLNNGLSPEPDGDKDDFAGAVVLTKEPKASFDNYFRYDASIERALYRAINALEKIQSRRMREERLSQKLVPEMGLVSFCSTETAPPAPAQTMTAAADVPPPPTVMQTRPQQPDTSTAPPAPAAASSAPAGTNSMRRLVSVLPRTSGDGACSGGSSYPAGN
jgi:hypothetical protein